MDTLLRIGLSNAAVAVVLAVLAVAVGCLCRRPAVAHGLWLLVLLKLVTPPLVPVSLPWPADPEPAEAAGKPEVVTILPAPEEGLPVEEAAPVEVLDVRMEDSPSPAVPEATTTPAADGMPSWSWATVVGWVWLSGSAGWFLLAGLRLHRFHRLLRYARPAPPELQEEARRLARRMGLARCPGVWLLPGRLAPMLWAAGGAPRLLLPADLLDRVSAEGRATLLAHELAHLRRRDHWVRGLEFVALGLYWWHPVAWFARRELREAEEQCADAWVVDTLPGSGRTYASALVDTLDFLSVAPPVPLLASGLGQLSDLKRRLTMILRGTTPRSLGWRGRLAVCALALLLPLLPTWAQAQTPAPEPQPRVIQIQVGGDDKAGALPQGRVLKIQRLGAGADLDKARADLGRLQAELQKKMAEVRVAELKLALAEKARVARVVQVGQDTPAIRIEISGVGKDDVALKDLLKKLEGGLGGTKRRVIIIVREGGSPRGDVVYRAVKVLPNKPPVAIKPAPGFVVPFPPGKPGLPATRSRDLEKRLEDLQRALESLRRELKEGKSGKPVLRPPGY